MTHVACRASMRCRRRDSFYLTEGDADFARISRDSSLGIDYCTCSPHKSSDAHSRRDDGKYAVIVSLMNSRDVATYGEASLHGAIAPIDGGMQPLADAGTLRSLLDTRVEG